MPAQLDERIQQRIDARREADEVAALISGSLAALPNDDARVQFWKRLRSTTPILVDGNAGDAKPEKPEPLLPMSDRESKEFGGKPMEFGKHKGTRVDEVPLEYLLWLSQTKDQFKIDLRRYVMSRRIQAEQED